MNVILVLSAAIQQFREGFICKFMGQHGSHGESSFFLSKYNDRGKFYHRCVSVDVKCENQMKTIFHSFPLFACWSEGMSHGSSSIIAQSLETLQQNGPKLKNISNNNKYMFYH